MVLRVKTQVVDNKAVNPALATTLRQILQFVASGGLTVAVNAIAGHFSPADDVYILGGFHILVTFAQNYLENKGLIPAIFKTIEQE